MLAGFVLGILEALTAGYIASSMKDAVGFLLRAHPLVPPPSACSAASPRSAPRCCTRSTIFTYQSLASTRWA